MRPRNHGNYLNCGAGSAITAVQCRPGRKDRAQSTIELAVIAGILTVVAIFCSDVGVVALGSSINDRACRDAARAAAQGSNYAQALSLAQAALKMHTADGYFVTNPVLTTSSFTYEDFSGSPPADTSPYVQVTTTNQVRVPIPVFFFGASFGASSGGMMTFSRTYTFPIVKTTLYLS